MDSSKKWKPPDFWTKITTTDLHTEGEPLRVVTGGFPDISGDTMLERRRYAMENLNHLRKVLMAEPRGHSDMYGCIVTPPVSSEANIGVLFFHNEGFSTMCGHGTIGVATFVLETRMLTIEEPETTIKIDTPAGLVIAHARIERGKVQSVYFQNVPSFALALDEMIEVPELGRIRCDIAFGGAFYAYVQAEDVGVSLTPESCRELIKKGLEIKRAIKKTVPIVHPLEEELGFIYGTIFIGPPLGKKAHSRNVCIFADGEVDRSPTGTGVSGRLAIHHARDEIEINQSLTIESIIGSCFTGRVIETTRVGPHRAIIPEVEGSAYIIGQNEFLINPEDPLKEGFLLR
jgi:trans-L-3-hydroxyproline dehydratase